MRRRVLVLTFDCAHEESGEEKKDQGAVPYCRFLADAHDQPDSPDFND
jgi:hypothetical protein